MKVYNVRNRKIVWFGKNTLDLWNGRGSFMDLKNGKIAGNNGFWRERRGGKEINVEEIPMKLNFDWEKPFSRLILNKWKSSKQTA